MWCRLRVLIFTANYFCPSQNPRQMIYFCREFSSILSLLWAWTHFFFFSVGVGNLAPLPPGSITPSEIRVASSWYQLVFVPLTWFHAIFGTWKFLFFFFLSNLVMWKMFLLPYLSIYIWQGPIWVSSVGGVVRRDLGNFLYILLKLFYIEAWHAILPFAISIHLLSPERKILQTGCCLALGFKFIEYENECMTWVLSSKSSAERQLVCRSLRRLYLIPYIVYAIRNCWINVCLIEWEGKQL